MQKGIMEVEIMIEGYITVKEAAEKWGQHIRSVQLMCSEGESWDC